MAVLRVCSFVSVVWSCGVCDGFSLIGIVGKDFVLLAADRCQYTKHELRCIALLHQTTTEREQANEWRRTDARGGASRCDHHRMCMHQWNALLTIAFAPFLCSMSCVSYPMIITHPAFCRTFHHSISRSPFYPSVTSFTHPCSCRC